MSRNLVASHDFVCYTAADAERIWALLTGADEISGYLYGLVPRSTWQPGASIVFLAGPAATAGDVSTKLIGEVVNVQPPCQLSYTLQSAPDDPPTYLTWAIRGCPNGSTIRLRIDEFDYPDTDEEAEDRWLPVLAVLQARLSNSSPDPEPS